jgi:hypothetical protein
MSSGNYGGLNFDEVKGLFNRSLYKKMEDNIKVIKTTSENDFHKVSRH